MKDIRWDNANIPIKLPDWAVSDISIPRGTVETKPMEERIYRFVEIPASYQGGGAKLLEFLKTNFNSSFNNSDKAKPEKISVLIVIQFIINSNRKICDPQIVNQLRFK